MFTLNLCFNTKGICLSERRGPRMRFINKKLMLFMTNVFLLAGIGSTIANYSTSVIQGEAASYSSRFNSAAWGVSYGETWVSGSNNSGSISSPRGIRVDTTQTGANATTSNSYSNILDISLLFAQSNGISSGNAGRGTITVDIIDSNQIPTNILTININAILSPNPKVEKSTLSSPLSGKLKITVTSTINSIVIAEILWNSSESPTNDRFVRISNSADLIVGRRYIISSGGAISSNYFALSTDQQSSNRTATGVTRDTTNHTIQNTNAIQKFTLEIGNIENTYSFYTGSGYIYASSSGSNEIKTEVSKSNNSSWTIAFSSTNADLIAQGSNTRNYMRFNNVSPSILFSCYASGSSTGSATELFMELPETAAEYSSYFISVTQPYCDNLNVTESLWNDVLKPKYNLMESSAKNDFFNNSSEALTRYNYILGKYSYSNF